MSTLSSVLRGSRGPATAMALRRRREHSGVAIGGNKARALLEACRLLCVRRVGKRRMRRLEQIAVRFVDNIYSYTTRTTLSLLLLVVDPVAASFRQLRESEPSCRIRRRPPSDAGRYWSPARSPHVFCTPSYFTRVSTEAVDRHLRTAEATRARVHHLEHTVCFHLDLLVKIHIADRSEPPH